MNRPEKMNALSHALWDDLFAASDQAEKMVPFFRDTSKPGVHA